MSWVVSCFGMYLKRDTPLGQIWVNECDLDLADKFASEEDAEAARRVCPVQTLSNVVRLVPKKVGA